MREGIRSGEPRRQGDIKKNKMYNLNDSKKREYAALYYVTRCERLWNRDVCTEHNRGYGWW